MVQDRGSASDKKAESRPMTLESKTKWRIMSMLPSQSKQAK